MIAALYPQRGNFLNRRTLGDDIADPGMGLESVDDNYNPSNAPPDEGDGLYPISDPIQIVGTYQYGPAVPPGFVPPSGTELDQYQANPPTQVATTDEPVSVGGLQFPAGTTGIDDAGNPVNSSGHVLTPTGAVASNPNPIGIVTPIAQAATKIAQLAVTSQVAGSPTIYPAPPGTTLPAGAIGLNAQGYPINAQGQILSSTPLTASWFTTSTLISGVPNWGILAGGLAALMVLPTLFSGGKKRR